MTPLEAQAVLELIDRMAPIYNDFFKIGGMKTGKLPITSSYQYKQGIKKLRKIAGYEA